MSFWHLLAFIIEGFAILVLAKLARDAVVRLRGYSVSQIITAKDNTAAATEQAGYLFGVLLGSLGAIVVPSSATSFSAVGGAVAMAGMIAIVLQLAADALSDRLIFRGIDDRKAILEDQNLALAVGKAGVSIATGLVVGAAMSDADATLLTCVLWFAVAQLAMILVALVYQKLTPYDDLAEIADGNVAAGLPIAGILVATGMLVESATSGSFEAWSQDLLAIGQYLGTGLLLIYLLRIFTDWFLLPKVRLSDEIAKDRNTGAGLLEGMSFVLAAFIVTYFLS